MRRPSSGVAIAAVRARSRDIARIKTADFLLPIFGPVPHRRRDQMLNGRGFVLIRGPPVEDGSFRHR
jgi:hypothetical protein